MSSRRDVFGVCLLLLIQVGCSLSHLLWMASSDPIWLGGDSIWHLDMAGLAARRMQGEGGSVSGFFFSPNPYPQLLSLVTGAVHQLLGMSYWAPWLVMQAFSFGLGFLAYVLARPLGPSGALLAGSLTLLSPALLVEGKRYMLDLPTAVFTLAAFICWSRGVALAPSPSGIAGVAWTWGAALMTLLAVSCKYQALFWIVPALPFQVLSLRGLPRRGRVHGLLALGVPLLCGGVSLWRSLDSLNLALSYNTSGPHSYLSMAADLPRLSSEALSGPLITASLPGVIWWMSRRAGPAPALYLSVVLFALCSPVFIKPRYLLVLVPLSAWGVTCYLWEVTDRTRRGWLGLSLAAAMAWPWLPLLGPVDLPLPEARRRLWTEMEYGRVPPQGRVRPDRGGQDWRHPQVPYPFLSPVRLAGGQAPPPEWFIAPNSLMPGIIEGPGRGAH